MIGKIVTGKSFKGAVEYVMNKPGARLLSSDGVNTSDTREAIRSFNFQRKARPEKAEVVGHVSLSFYANNFTNSRRAVASYATGVAAIFTPDFYYGLSLRLKF